MSRSVCFAHLTDIHLSENKESWGTLSLAGERIFSDVVHTLNADPSLDFVLITGDVLDLATEAEVSAFRGVISSLNRPWHFVPGNHDGYIDPARPGVFSPDEGASRIDPRMANPTPHAQQAYWSRGVADGVRLIGLDSRYADTWNGIIGSEQLKWLSSELSSYADHMVIIAVHHPLHNITPRNAEPFWSNFVVDNAVDVNALLDEYPNVKLVLAGHHHAQQIRPYHGRLHVNTAALTGYPCVYRIIRLQEQAGGWQVDIKTHYSADEGMRKRAYDLLEESNIANLYDPDNIQSWAELVAGKPPDQAYNGLVE